MLQLEMKLEQALATPSANFEASAMNDTELAQELTKIRQELEESRKHNDMLNGEIVQLEMKLETIQSATSPAESVAPPAAESTTEESAEEINALKTQLEESQKQNDMLNGEIVQLNMK